MQTRNSYYKNIINTFASQYFAFEENNEPFLLENASNLTHEFLQDNFNKKNFVKIVIKKTSVKLDVFSRRNGSFFSQKPGAEKQKC